MKERREAQRSAAVSKVSWKCRVACSVFQSQHRYVALAVKDSRTPDPLFDFRKSFIWRYFGDFPWHLDERGKP